MSTALTPSGGGGSIGGTNSSVASAFCVGGVAPVISTTMTGAVVMFVPLSKREAVRLRAVQTTTTGSSMVSADSDSISVLDGERICGLRSMDADTRELLQRIKNRCL
jgi:hypothetical protein